MENKENILEVENLQVSFHTYAGEVKAVRGVSFSFVVGVINGMKYLSTPEKNSWCVRR